MAYVLQTKTLVQKNRWLMLVKDLSVFDLKIFYLALASLEKKRDKALVTPLACLIIIALNMVSRELLSSVKKA